MRKRSRKSCRKGKQLNTSAGFFSSGNVLSVPSLENIPSRITVNADKDAFERVLTELSEYGIEWQRKDTIEDSIKESLQVWVDSIVGDTLNDNYNVRICDKEYLKESSEETSFPPFDEFIVFNMYERFSYYIGKYFKYLSRRYSWQLPRYILDLFDHMPIHIFTPNEAYWHLREFDWGGGESEIDSWRYQDMTKAGEEYDGVRLKDWKAAYPEWAYDPDHRYYEKGKRYRPHCPQGLREHLVELERCVNQCQKKEIGRNNIGLLEPVAGIVAAFEKGDLIEQQSDDQHNYASECGWVWSSSYCVPMTYDGMASMKFVLEALVAAIRMLKYCDEGKRKKVTIAGKTLIKVLA